jgi:hypothetical protein
LRAADMGRVRVALEKVCNILSWSTGAYLVRDAAGDVWLKLLEGSCRACRHKVSMTELAGMGSGDDELDAVKALVSAGVVEQSATTR